jgi:probable rRNA maturation factor
MQRSQVPSVSPLRRVRHATRVARPPDITIQFATARAGVPHPRALRRWAVAALHEVPMSPKLRRAVKAQSSLSIRIVDSLESRRLNRTWRGKDKATNVLSFPAPRATGDRQQATARRRRLHALPPPASSLQPPALPLGDLIICAPVVVREAREQCKAPQAHWAHMVIHGVLHLLGYDHEVDRDAEVMESREVNLLANFGYANPYA